MTVAVTTETLSAFLSNCVAPGLTVRALVRPRSGWETEIQIADLHGAGRPADWPARVVLRLYPSTAATPRAVLEHRVLTSLHALGFPVPRTLWLETDPAPFGGPFLLMETIEGTTYEELSNPMSAAERAEMLARAIRLFTDLHRLDWRPLVGTGPLAVWPDLEAAAGSYSEPWLRRLIAGSRIAAAVDPAFEWLHRRRTAVPNLRPSLIHGDFHGGNLLIRPADDRWFLIDWSGAGIADPRIDLACTAMLAAGWGDTDEVSRLHAAYVQASGAPLTEMDYFEAFALTRRLIIMGAALELGPGAIGLRPDLPVRSAPLLKHLRQLQTLLQERIGPAAARLDTLIASWETAP